MIIVGFTGLHGAGKSHAAHRLQALSGWHLVNKLVVLRGLYEDGWQRENANDSWEIWYRDVYRRIGGDTVIRQVLQKIGSTDVCILDAIHSPVEWQTILSLHPSSLLVVVSSPASARAHRRSELFEEDTRRIEFWHHGGMCLQTYAHWAITGMLSHHLLESTCRELVAYVDTLVASTSPP